MSDTTVFIGIGLAVAMVAALLVPYLIKEIRRGKAEVGPRVPTGAGDFVPGRPGHPAPGKPDGQASPYSADAQRGGPPVKS
jgi:hypothetical protein